MDIGNIIFCIGSLIVIMVAIGCLAYNIGFKDGRDNLINQFKQEGWVISKRNLHVYFDNCEENEND